jgi:hypothetical protein
VAQEDVSAVMYRILQHMPLLPSTAHTDSSSSRSKQQQAGFGTQWQQQQQQMFQDTAQQQQQQQQHTRQQQRLQEFAGFTTTLHTVYFDNRGLELYHGRLYLRPNTQTLKARWIGHSDGCWAPARVVLERKVYKEGWKGESNAKESLLIAGDVLPSYLVGTYCLGDALSQLYELPALQQTLQQTLGHLQQRRQQRQAAQQRQQQLLQLSPFAAASAAAAAVDRMQAGSSAVTAAVGSQAAAADAEVAGAVAAAGIRVPQGVVLGSSFNYSVSHGSGILGSSSNCGQQVHSFEGVNMLVQQHQHHQQHQQQQQQPQPQVDSGGSHVHWGTDVTQQQQQQQQPGLVLSNSQLDSTLDSTKSQLSSQLQQAQLQQQQQQSYLQHPAAAAAAAAAGGYVDDSSGSEDDESDDEDVQFSGSSSSRNPAAAYTSRQQQQQHPFNLHDMPLSVPVTLPAAAAAAAAEAGFEDAYLDPPMPSSDQLSLFSEVQRLIGRKRLQPVLHCALQRMLFAMPFDERLKITLDTDVAISAVVSIIYVDHKLINACKAW